MAAQARIADVPQHQILLFMQIALTADPELPVPPVLYGGIERIIDILARGLAAKGHEVTLFAHPASRTAGNLVPWTGAASDSHIDTLRNSITLARRVYAGRYDLIHSFSRIAYMLPILPFSIPKLMTYQRPIARRSVELGHRLSAGTLWFSAVSKQMMKGLQDVGTWRLVYNGVPLSSYTFRAMAAPDAPLVFLGRIEEVKGPHLAIEIARLSGRPLVIAGNVASEHKAWFDVHVGPHIDQKTIRYIGPVDDAAKNELLGGAAALLMPILWEEPFGIVMAEALACGTPVIGFARGAVPEVIEDGITGFIGEGVRALANAVARIPEIDRQACRKRAEDFFSDSAVVDAYVSIYGEMIAARKKQR
jgi:glycosyltransferase involved in cell wall biosynthesis